MLGALCYRAVIGCCAGGVLGLWVRGGSRSLARGPAKAQGPPAMAWGLASAGPAYQLGWVGGCGGSWSQLVDCIGERGYRPGPHYLAMAGPSLLKPPWCHPLAPGRPANSTPHDHQGPAIKPIPPIPTRHKLSPLLAGLVSKGPWKESRDSCGQRENLAHTYVEGEGYQLPPPRPPSPYNPLRSNEVVTMMNAANELVRFELGLSPIQAALVLERVLARRQTASAVLQNLVDRGLEVEDEATV
jgi:hypothetical protein